MGGYATECSGFRKYNILHKHQYGFRSKHSTKAPDTTNHNVLLYKLNHYGIRETRNQWFASYLSNRKQYIEIDKRKLSLNSKNNGIPHESTLGPVIFLIYINDIINSTSLSMMTQPFTNQVHILMFKLIM